ncbi:unnamed protein product, partial [Heterotrigona itama]
KGLGKHENGITEALKPKLKFDTAGLGHKNKEWDNWWEHAFDKAANNIKVVSKTNKVTIFVSKENATNDLKEDLTEKESKYGNFLRSCTLFNGNVLIKDSSNTCKEQDTEKNINDVPLMDEELFKICNGRTNGRIAQQDKYLLSTDSCTNISTKLQNNNTILHNNEYEEINDENIIVTLPENEIRNFYDEYEYVTKNYRKRISYLSDQLNVVCNISDSNETNIHTISKKRLEQENKQKNKKKRKREKGSSMSYDTESFEKDKIDNISNYSTVPPSKSTSKKVIKKNVQNQANDHTENKHIDIKKKKRRKKKFKKEKNEINQHENITNTWEDDDPNNSQAKKFKRSHKTDLDLHLIKNEDIKTEDKFQAEFSGNEVPIKSNNVTWTPVYAVKSVYKPNTDLKKKVDYLNAKIKKKKLSKLRRKEKIELDKITKSLKAVHLNTEESIKEKNIKNELKAITQNIMNVTLDKTESLKKKKRKTKKKEKLNS